MKRICKFLIVILFFSIATGCVGTNKDSGLEVKILDQNLESAIREAIGKPDAPIYVKDLEGLTELDVSAKGIADITGLEYCTNLKVLNLGINRITDIALLSQLVHLKRLWLNDNRITDIAPLSQLVNLKELGLWGNRITDIAPLVRNAGLSKGDRVDLSANPLSSESIDVYIPQLQQRGVDVIF